MDSSVSTTRVEPLEKLTSDGVLAIHEASLEILSEIGVRIDHEEALELLETNGCAVDHDERMVTFPSSLVEDCIDAAPSSFTIHARNPDRTIEVGEGGYVTSPAGNAPNVLTYDGGRRSSTLEDYERMVKLTQTADAMTTSGYNHCEPNDVPQEIKHFRLLERTIELTDKPLKGDAWGADRARASIEMAGIANDDRDVGKPYVFTIVNSVSPRVWDTKMVGGLMEYARHGQPVVLSPAVMASASGPSTLAGTLALGNAEILAGNVIAQLTNEGTPIGYGLPTSNVDVRYGSFSIGSPEGALCVSFAGQMGRFYDVPVRAGGGLTDAKVPDFQAGGESMLQLFVAITSGVDLIHHAAGMLDSYSTSSPEKFVADCQLLEYVDRFREGFDIGPETLATDLVAEVEPGGHFLNKRHTLEHSKTSAIFPDLFYRDSYDNWEDDGKKDAFERAHELVETRLEEYERPALDEETLEELEEYVERGVKNALGS